MTIFKLHWGKVQGDNDQWKDFDVILTNRDRKAHLKNTVSTHPCSKETPTNLNLGQYSLGLAFHLQEAHVAKGNTTQAHRTQVGLWDSKPYCWSNDLLDFNNENKEEKENGGVCSKIKRNLIVDLPYTFSSNKGRFRDWKKYILKMREYAIKKRHNHSVPEV